MKTKEEIQKMALERFPLLEEDTSFYNQDDNYEIRLQKKSFIEGYELAQQETLKLEKINAELIDLAASAIRCYDKGNPLTLQQAMDKLEQALANAKQSK